MRRLRNAQSGMSATGLIVLVIAATFVVIIIATAIPSFLASREPGQRSTTVIQLKANEASVISALRSIHSAEATYAVTNGEAYGTFADMISANLLDSTWAATQTRNGYRFTLITATDGLGFCVAAERTSVNVGDNSYSISNQGAIYRLPGDSAPACNADTGVISTGKMLGS